jgi:hypothetical protein
MGVAENRPGGADSMEWQIGFSVLEVEACRNFFFYVRQMFCSETQANAEFIDSGTFWHPSELSVAAIGSDSHSLACDLRFGEFRSGGFDAAGR